MTISGATETAYEYLKQYYTFPENIIVSHLPQELKSSNKPIKILWAHHAYDQQVYQNFSHEQVTHIVTPSNWAKQTLQHFHKIPENKITVIPNGVDSQYTYSNQKQKQLIYTSIPYKALPVLASVIPLVHSIHPDAKFKIFSSMSLYGPQNDPYFELYDYLKSLPNVEYSRAIDRQQLISHYQDSAFFISPCIWEETFGVSMCEAMRCGAYPIITDIGALEEVAGPNLATVVPIEGQRTPKGFEVTENFVKQFAEATCVALDYFDKDRETYNQVSKSCSDWVVGNYDWKRISVAWKDLVGRLEGRVDTSGEMLALNGATARSGGVGFGEALASNGVTKTSVDFMVNKISRKGETYVEDKVEEVVSVGSYFNHAKYNS
jgi:glycosyltransferase involved in cell wall biosynthesis